VVGVGERKDRVRIPLSVEVRKALNWHKLKDCLHMDSGKWGKKERVSSRENLGWVSAAEL